ncbi:MAG: tRNA (N6-threonylcarbamoyladenosine(37)-N6)-methyltransferase TrmO [Asgard group archaeon]|nr:tRNA (N6-threonylcarbamoyladenosine(37)-N6)-methyltransferase TrmO [Asgard group archaeon]
MEHSIIFKPIGIIHTPFKKSDGMPIQAKFSNEKGVAKISNKYVLATQGLEEFSHIFLIYHFHEAKETKLLVKPFLSEKKMGLFAIRAPNRPNPIGISVVRIVDIIVKKNSVEIIFSGADMLDQTPLLDIKPYVSDFDVFLETRNGWYDKREIEKTTADSRFSKL